MVVVVAALAMTTKAAGMRIPRLAGVQLNEGFKEDVIEDRVVIVEKLFLIDKLSGGCGGEKDVGISLLQIK